MSGKLKQSTCRAVHSCLCLAVLLFLLPVDAVATTGTLTNAPVPAVRQSDSPATISEKRRQSVLQGSRQVFVIPVVDEFENALYLILVRAIRQAERSNAAAIILDLDTPGGRVDSAIKIRDLLIRTDIPTFAYVNPMAVSAGAFISVATDKIVMGENGSIGGALPITMGGTEGAQSAGKKFQSVFNAEMRKTAKTKGHPVDICEGFCNPDLVIPGMKEQGDIITLDFDEATSYGVASYQALTIQDLLDVEGLGDAEIVRFTETRTDKLARFLSSSVVMGLLMMIGMGGIILEIKTPGVGLPGAIGVTAILLYFSGSYLANLSDYMEWVLFTIGVILVIVEIYILPGFGIAGAAGIVLMVGALFFALMNLAPDGGFVSNLSEVRIEALKEPIYTLLGGFVAMIPAIYLAMRLLPSLKSFRGLVLDPDIGSDADGHGPEGSGASRADTGLMIGVVGIAVTDLHPAGLADFSGSRKDVLTDGLYLEKGCPVRIIRFEGNQILVGPADDSG